MPLSFADNDDTNESVDEAICTALFAAANNFEATERVNLGDENVIRVYHLFLNFKGEGPSYILLEDDDGWTGPLMYFRKKDAMKDWQKVKELGYLYDYDD